MPGDTSCLVTYVCPFLAACSLSGRNAAILKPSRDNGSAELRCHVDVHMITLDYARDTWEMYYTDYTRYFRFYQLWKFSLFYKIYDLLYRHWKEYSFFDKQNEYSCFYYHSQDDIVKGYTNYTYYFHFYQLWKFSLSYKIYNLLYRHWKEYSFFDKHKEYSCFYYHSQHDINIVKW
ncbi:hypothetical protein NDU88_003799 [Pleurodeles waltl]|uniref:Uncharacterized protein n=1 Tax=Pleurodeles waltl TaxID=8319 RepID=A0AAV7TRM6_PLEWA|nr:hypothetical protein NDU88_003799 [Pleurodeles waltl]